MPSAKLDVSVLQDVLDAFNAHDVDLIMSFFDDDCVMDMPHEAPGQGVAGWSARTRSGRASDPGSRGSRTPLRR